MRSLGVGLMLLLTGQSSVVSQLPDGEAALRRGDYDRAISVFEREITRRATPAAVRGLVQALSEVGRYEEAETVAARHAEPLAPEIWNTLGEARLTRGRLREAEAAFTKAIEFGASDSLVAKLNRALVYQRRGAASRAAAEFDTFIDAYNRPGQLRGNELMAVATAVQFLGARDPGLMKDALRAYDQAVAADPGNLEARARLGDLFLDKYNGPDAHETFDEILRVNPRYARAVLGKARTRHFDGSDEALELTKLSLDMNPNLVAARAFLGTLYLELENYDAAAAEARKALDIDPNSLEALSVLAASQFFSDDHTGFEATRRRVLALNAKYADLYNTLAELSARIRRYADAVAFAREAVALDSTSWRGYALLGRNELRLGAMIDGARRLETAFKGDPYDVWTKNTLDLLDTLQRYPETSSPRFRFVIDATESELLSLYATDLAEDAYDRLATRYGYRPATPIRVEIYPSHADFSVRTVGLVGLGALGVSFGPVIAMDSPSARDAGHYFNWGSTLWHELAHTFHLGMSDHRVPRWLTEGLAVLEERRARPGWGDDVSPPFLIAFLQDRLVPVSDLNRGFTRPAYPEQVIFSYYQASLVCEMIEAGHGFAAIRRMLAGYRDGKSTEDLFRSVLGTSPRAFDGAFTKYVQQRFAGALTALSAAARTGTERPTPSELALRAKADRDDFVAQLLVGQGLAQERQYAEAVPYLERAKVLFPEYAGPDSPYWYLAQIAKEQGDRRKAADELAALTAINERHYGALLDLAELREELHDTLGAVDALERAMYVYPFDGTVHERLAALYARQSRWLQVVRERQAVLALAPVDRAEANYQLALAYYNGGNFSEARRAVLHALERAPNFEKAQELLLSIHATRSRDNP